jgi:hypothetical protein
MAEREVPAATNNHQPNPPTSLPAAMAASLWRYWRERTDYQTFLGAAGVLLLASGMFHTVVFLVDGGPWDGPLSWRKPILFGWSFGITLLTLAWVLSYLPRRRRRGWLLAGILGVAGGRLTDRGRCARPRWVWSDGAQPATRPGPRAIKASPQGFPRGSVTRLSRKSPVGTLT